MTVVPISDLTNRRLTSSPSSSIPTTVTQFATVPVLFPDDAPEKTIPVRHLSADQIWTQLVEAGGLADAAKEEPKA